MIKKSKYNFIYERPDLTYVVCNTYKGSIAILSAEEKSEYDLLPETFESSKGIISEMYRLGMLVDEDIDETAEINAFRFSKTYLRRDAYFRILTTTGCNARCAYCYEKGIEPEIMSDETAEKTAEYILSHKGLEKIYLHWFGGEPLMNIRPIGLIFDKLKAQLSKETKVISYFTSNCSMMDEDTAKKLSEWNTEWFQVSIDGIDERYDKIKAYKNPEKYNFKNTIDGIESVLKQGITVNLCIKYWNKDLESVYETIDYLKSIFKEYAKNGLLKIFPSPLFEVPNASERTFGIRHTPDTGLIKAKEYLEKSGMTDGSDIFSISFKEGQCYACTEGSVVISPKGKLYKCALAMKDPQMCIGDIFTGIRYNANYFKWVTPIIPEECTNCIFLPLCQGGCRAGYFGYAEFGCYKTEYDFKSVIEHKIRKILE